MTKSIESLPSTKTAREKRKLDLRWLFAAVALIFATVAAIAINSNYEKQGTDKIANSLDIDNGDLKINWEQYQTVDIELNKSLTISESGTYHLTGTLEDGSITIDAGISEVRLLLDNVSIHNSSGPAIIAENAEDLVIELVGDNVLTDGENYDSKYDEDVTGAIYSKADLTFQGSGTLNLTSSYQDAIVGKDDVKFNSGTYNIEAADDAIRGKDSIYIVNGNFTILSNADCLKSTNELDAGKGFILIENGNLSLNSDTAKGIKATKSILLYGGYYTINTYDDAIHSDNYIAIVNGTINIDAGDDGIHANKELIIDGGNLYIAKAYEGIEAQVITINNGEISLRTNDDGINAGGGADNSSTNRPNNQRGASPFDADENCILNINGGNIYVNAAGDGIDSNGWLYFNGGTTVVDGPTNDGNGALDSGMGIVINGGEVLTVGSSGMAETLGSTSSVNNISIYLDEAQPANTTLIIKDSAGNTIIEHTSAKQFSHIAFGSAALKLGETYTLYLADEEIETFTISSITTTVGNNNNNFMRK